MNEEDALKALQFTSNVVELKPDKKYLLIFKDIHLMQLEQINAYLRKQGFDCTCIRTVEDVQVIEAPAKPDPSEFWRNLSRDMTINERRAVFKKLSELIGVPVNEFGEVEQEGEIKHQWSFEEAKAILEPYKKFEDYIS